MRPRLVPLIAAVLAGCVESSIIEIEPFVDSGKADGERRLRQVDRSRTEVEEPSDLVLAGDQLYAVSDSHSKIYRISRDGDIKDELDIEGHDLEGLAYDEDRDEFLIAEESEGTIWRVDRDGDRHDKIELDGARDGNSGLEGLVVGRGGHIFAVKEKDPARVYELDEDGRELDREKLEFTDDISAITFHDGRFYVLGDEEHSLYRLDRDWSVDYAWRLPMNHPEGLAFDGSTLYILSDSERRIYTFELD